MTPGKKPASAAPSRNLAIYQLRNAPHSTCQDGNDAPGDQDARNPDARADPVEENVARDFEDEIAPKEYPDQQPELRIRDRKRGIRRERWKSNVDTVQVGNHVQQKKQGYKPAANFTGRARANVVHRGKFLGEII
jgi:hypothetical protein